MTTAEQDGQFLNGSLGTLEWLTRINDASVSEQRVASPQHSDMAHTSSQPPSTPIIIDDPTPSLVRDAKPALSYAQLIMRAIDSSLSKRMTLSQIYAWIEQNFEYYKNAGTSWKNSIRHNLSLNRQFSKAPREKNDPGKGCYWFLSENPDPCNSLLGSLNGNAVVLDTGQSGSEEQQLQQSIIGACSSHHHHSPGSSLSDKPRINPAIAKWASNLSNSSNSSCGSEMQQGGHVVSLMSPVGRDEQQQPAALNLPLHSSMSSESSLPSGMSLMDINISADCSASFQDVYRSLFRQSLGSSGIQSVLQNSQGGRSDPGQQLSTNGQINDVSSPAMSLSGSTDWHMELSMQQTDPEIALDGFSQQSMIPIDNRNSVTPPARLDNNRDTVTSASSFMPPIVVCCADSRLENIPPQMSAPTTQVEFDLSLRQLHDLERSISKGESIEEWFAKYGPQYMQVAGSSNNFFSNSIGGGCSYSIPSSTLQQINQHQQGLMLSASQILRNGFMSNNDHLLSVGNGSVMSNQMQRDFHQREHSRLSNGIASPSSSSPHMQVISTDPVQNDDSVADTLDEDFEGFDWDKLV